MSTFYPETQAIAELIGNSIKEKGLSIRQTAELANVSYSHLSKIIRQEVPIPKPIYLEKLVQPLNLSFCELFISAGYFTNFSAPRDYYSSKPIFADLDVDQKQILESYLIYHKIKFPNIEPEKDTEEAQKNWWFVFDAMQDYPQKCNMLLSLLKANASYQIIDEAFYIFDLIPVEFMDSSYTPMFGKLTTFFAQALIDAVYIQRSQAKESLHYFWESYENDLQKIIDSQTNKSLKVQQPNDQNKQLELDNPQNQGFKILSTPDGKVYGRLDFNIPNDKLTEVFSLVAKLQHTIKDFCDSETD
jgi:transcriptional regulator with XRE-family HTH domain